MARPPGAVSSTSGGALAVENGNPAMESGIVVDYGGEESDVDGGSTVGERLPTGMCP